MRRDVRQFERKRTLNHRAAGLALGVPLTFSVALVGGISAQAAEPGRTGAIQQTAAPIDAAPISAQSAAEKPQFQPQQYQSEVQRQLNLLYQQDSQAGSAAGANLPPLPPAGVQPPA